MVHLLLAFLLAAGGGRSAGEGPRLMRMLAAMTLLCISTMGWLPPISSTFYVSAAAAAVAAAAAAAAHLTAAHDGR
jgi:hypothetical protein